MLYVCTVRFNMMKIFEKKKILNGTKHDLHFSHLWGMKMALFFVCVVGCVRRQVTTNANASRDVRTLFQVRAWRPLDRNVFNHIYFYLFTRKKKQMGSGTRRYFNLITRSSLVLRTNFCFDLPFQTADPEADN